MDDCTNSLLRLLQLIKVKHTVNQVIDTLHVNPAYPSMLAITETLSHYGIVNAAIQISNNQINKLPLPFIAQVSTKKDSTISGGSFFSTIKRVTENEVVGYDENNKIKKLNTNEFLKTWSGIVILAEKNETSIEPNYANNAKVNNLRIILLALFTISISTLIVNELFKTAINANLILIGYFILKCIGITIATLIIIYEIATYKPALQKFCFGGKKMNCEMVVNSKYAQILGSNISLGTITFAYFFATILIIIISSFTKSVFLGNISLLTFPAIIYSIYLQSFKIKKWCKLCIAIAIVLTIEVAMVIIYNMYGTENEMSHMLLFSTLFLSVLVFFNWLNPIVLKSKSLNLYKSRLNNIKSNPKIFETLLNASRRIETNPQGLGILFKNKNAKHHVLKVCNPYCDPCAKAHHFLDALFKNGTIDLQIIFSIADQQDFKAKPVSYFMSIYSKNGEVATQKVLSHWYNSKIKDFDEFAKHFPVPDRPIGGNSEMNEQSESLKAMATWCKKENISHTPTIFIDGFELPHEYQVKNLQHFLK